MKFPVPAALAALLMVVLTAGCAGPRNPGGGLRTEGGERQDPRLAQDRERSRDLQSILRYDADGDGVLTRAELDAGIARDFRAADRNADGVLDRGEINAENDRRSQVDGTQASPLIDWNRDGAIDMTEFGTSARTLFEQSDTDKNGRLTAEELRPPRREPPRNPRPIGGGEGPNFAPPGLRTDPGADATPRIR